MGRDKAIFPADVELDLFDAVDSTSDEARRRAVAGHPGPLWIAARSQTSGRGRRGRTWVSPVGNLYATHLIRPQITAADAGRLSFLAAVALHRALAPMVPAPHRLKLKWPNDVLVDNAKIAGILLESQSGAGGIIDWMTIGIGVNLAHAPQGVDNRTVALADLGVRIDPIELLAPLARQTADLLSLFRTRGFADIHGEWVTHAAGIGEPIRVRLSNATLDGVFAGLDVDGTLLLDQGGVTRRIAAGDVFLNPPASHMTEDQAHAAGD